MCRCVYVCINEQSVNHIFLLEKFDVMHSCTGHILAKISLVEASQT